MANLPETQARPKRPVFIPIAALLLIGVAVAIGRSRDEGGMMGEATTEGPVHRIDSVTASRPNIGVLKPSATDIHVRVAYGSRVQILKGRQWAEVNLNDLGKHLAKRERHHRVVLTVDRNTPWIHIQWIMLICAEERMPNLAFQVERAPMKGRKRQTFLLDAALPVDSGVAGPLGGGLDEPEETNEDKPGKPIRGRRDSVSVKVMVVPGADKQQRWGVPTVLMPTQVRYLFGDRNAVELASVARWLLEARKVAPQSHGEIKALGRARFESIVRLMVEYRHAGYAHVDFYGTMIPTKEVREMPVLPYPGKPQPTHHTLTFELAEGKPGDLERAEAIIRARLKKARIESTTTTRTADGLTVTVPTGIGIDMGLVLSLVESQGATLVFHITVEPTDPNYENEWKRLKQVGEASPGLRWYPLSAAGKKSFPMDRRPKREFPYVLCKLDDCNITGASLSNAAYQRNIEGMGGDWNVVFNVRKEHRANMLRLTAEVGTFLAIIVNGEVHSAPVLNSELSDTGQISGGFSEADAKLLATLLGSEQLPVRLKHRRKQGR